MQYRIEVMVFSFAVLLIAQSLFIESVVGDYSLSDNDESISIKSKANLFCDQIRGMHIESKTERDSSESEEETSSDSDLDSVSDSDSDSHPITVSVTTYDTYIKECTKKIAPVLKGMNSKRDDIYEFIEQCKRFYNFWTDCINMAIRFKNLQFKMAGAIKLLRFAKKDDFDDVGGIKNINISQQQLIEWRKIINFNPCSCLKEVSTASLSKSNLESQIIAEYKYWYDKHQTSYCSCTEVFGLYRIFHERKGVVPHQQPNTFFSSLIETFTNQNLNYLEKYYDKICSDTIPDRSDWKKDQFIGISKSTTVVDVNLLKTFLSRCQILAKSKWYDQKDESKNRHWPFEYIIDSIGLTKSYFWSQNLDLIAYGIRAKVSFNSFKEMNRMFSSCSVIKSPSCKYTILETIFKLDYYEKSKTEVSKEGNKEKLKDIEADYDEHLQSIEDIWTFSDEEGKNVQLAYFTRTFCQISNPTILLEPVEICDTFVELVDQFQTEYKKTDWTKKFITRVLKDNKEKGHLELDVIVDCVKFYNKINKAVKKQLKTKFKGRKIFAKKLFRLPKDIAEKICREEDPIYDRNNKQRLRKLLKFVKNYEVEIKENK